jgi:hypothetical protein
MDPIKKCIHLFILLAFFPILFAACQRSEKEVTGDVELHLLDSFETSGQSCEIVASSVVTDSVPLIRYTDFESYNSKTCVFIVTDNAREAVEAIEFPVNGRAFGLYADNELIYTGYFWPSYSSLSCQWIVIDPFILSWGLGNELHVELGYPGLTEGVVIPDERNNEKILAIFRRDGKLIK